MQLCGEGHGLGMIAGREREHAARTLRISQRIDRVVATTKLERTHALKVLGLHEHLATEHAVQRGAGENRGAMRDAFEASGGGLDVGEIEHPTILEARRFPGGPPQS